MQMILNLESLNILCYGSILSALSDSIYVCNMCLDFFVVKGEKERMSFEALSVDELITTRPRAAARSGGLVEDRAAIAPLYIQPRRQKLLPNPTWGGQLALFYVFRDPDFPDFFVLDFLGGHI